MREQILVIDDETVVLDSCRRILTAAGYDVATASEPRQGLDMAAGKQFDVILCDWQMPQMDGMAVMEALERISPQSAVVMITGYATVGRATEAMQRGALDFVPKPFTPDEITEIVRKAMQRRLSRDTKALGRFEGLLQAFQFPKPELDDKPPKTIAETVAATIGTGKATSPWFSIFVLGTLAGAYIGFGGLLSTSVTFDLAAGLGIKKLIAGAAFSLGLMLVVIAGAELFTGNNLMISSAVTGRIGWRVMLSRWALVYGANFIGSLLLVFLFYFSGLWKTGGSALGRAAVAIGAAKVSLGFGEALVRGIGCNWLVCLAVWMALAARQTISKIFAVFFPITAFVAIGFEHCVANMYFIPAAILLQHWGLPPPGGSPEAAGLTWLAFVWRNLVPVTIGNIIGGAVFVGLSYWSAYLRPAPVRK